MSGNLAARVRHYGMVVYRFTVVVGVVTRHCQAPPAFIAGSSPLSKRCAPSHLTRRPVLVRYQQKKQNLQRQNRQRRQQCPTWKHRQTDGIMLKWRCMRPRRPRSPFARWTLKCSIERCDKWDGVVGPSITWTRRRIGIENLLIEFSKQWNII